MIDQASFDDWEVVWVCDRVRAAMVLDKFSRGEIGDGRKVHVPTHAKVSGYGAVECEYRRCSERLD